MAGRRVGLFPREMFLREKVFPGYLYGFRNRVDGGYLSRISTTGIVFSISDLVLYLNVPICLAHCPEGILMTWSS